MSDGTITLYTNNILEDGTFSVAGAASADTGYPETRLHDRTAELFWKISSENADDFGWEGDDFGWEGDGFGELGGDYEFKIDQSADIQSVDLLFIAGHNWANKWVRWQWSADGAAWTDAVTAWVQSGDGNIIKTLSTALDKAFWRVLVRNLINPMASEIIMSAGRTFTIVSKPNPIEQPRSNVEWSKSIGGLERSITLGDALVGWTYDIRTRSAAALALFRAAMADLDEYSKPFLLKDLNGNYYLMRLQSDPGIEYDPPLTEHMDFPVIEVL